MEEIECGSLFPTPQDFKPKIDILPKKVSVFDYSDLPADISPEYVAMLYKPFNLAERLRESQKSMEATVSSPTVGEKRKMDDADVKSNDEMLAELIIMKKKSNEKQVVLLPMPTNSKIKINAQIFVL